MCLKELMCELKRAGVKVSESQIRWALRTGRVSRPRVDGSLRFDFTVENVADLATYFSEREVSHHAK